MLLVPTFVGPSPIQGFGLFTPVPLPAGATIWAFDAAVDLRLSQHEMSALPEHLQPRLREWCYEEPSGSYVLCGDNAKFMNHSFEPNCIDLEWYSTVTSREIAAGEELTCDYRLIDMESARSGLVGWLRALDNEGMPDRAGALTFGVPKDRPADERSEDALERLWDERLDGPLPGSCGGRVRSATSPVG